MSRESLKVAIQAHSQLPKFSSQREARSRLLAIRNEHLSRLRKLAKHAPDFRFDSTPTSLKQLEAWYFALIDTSFRPLGTSRGDFEDCMTSYFCHVVAANHPDAKWVVEESPFVPGHFEIGIELENGTWAGSFRDHFRMPGNKRHTQIFRDYKKYFGDV